MKQILIAGIGNIFMGDDAFGCEVVAELLRRGPHSSHVQIVDYGIRGYDLARALVEPFDTIVLVDSMAHGKPPGTVSLIEIEPDKTPPPEKSAPDAHSLHPAAALQIARALGEVRARLFLVGCEPAALADENGEMELSAAVKNAIVPALEIITELIGESADRGAPLKEGSLAPTQSPRTMQTI